MALIKFSLVEQVSGERDAARPSAAFQDKAVLMNEGGVDISIEKHQEHPSVFQIRGSIVAIYGTPNFAITHEAKKAIAKELVVRPDQTCERLDSSFLIVIAHRAAPRSVEIISDRFNSRLGFMFVSERTVIVSTSLVAAIAEATKLTTCTPDWQSVFQFLWFRRVFGNRTHCSEITTTSPGCRIMIRESQITQTQFWRYSHEGRDAPFKKMVDAVAQSTQEGIERTLSNSQVNGLMLSGGLDSRLMLAVGGDRYLGITNAPSENQEVAIARQLATIAGAEHVWIPRPKTYLGGIFEQAVAASDALTVYYECQFLGYGEQLGQLCGSVSLGLFYDIFFCGHYLPKYQPKVLGRNMLFFRPAKIPDENFSKYFVENVSYRQKQTNLISVLDPDFTRDQRKKMDEEIAKIHAEASSCGLPSGEATWEYTHLVNLGRHYSMLMAKSIRGHIDVHLPALTNDNFDLALCLSPRHKRNWELYLAVLKKLDKSGALMEVKNANTSIPAKFGLKTQSLIKLAKGVTKKVNLYSGIVSPAFSDRSWPEVRSSIADNAGVRSAIEQAIEEGVLVCQNIVHKKTVQELYSRTIRGQEDHSIFLSQLISLEKSVLAGLSGEIDHHGYN